MGYRMNYLQNAGADHNPYSSPQNSESRCDKPEEGVRPVGSARKRIFVIVAIHQALAVGYGTLVCLANTDGATGTWRAMFIGQDPLLAYVGSLPFALTAVIMYVLGAYVQRQLLERKRQVGPPNDNSCPCPGNPDSCPGPANLDSRDEAAKRVRSEWHEVKP